MAVARDLQGKKNHVIAVIGDGAMTGGQAYEAMNNAGYLGTNLIIILNDNKQVSLPTATVDGPAPPVGALSQALARLHSSTKFRRLREAAKVARLSCISWAFGLCYLTTSLFKHEEIEFPNLAPILKKIFLITCQQGISKQIGGQTHEIAAKIDTYTRGMASGSGASLFEELGLYYIGPVDGHNVEDLVDILKNVEAMPAAGPVLIHVITEKGKGYAPAEVAADKMHGTPILS